MKIRTGFVSNSSSSSFIVTFPSVPKTIEECEKMMFPKGEEKLFNGYITYSAYEVAKRVFLDIQSQLDSGSNMSDRVKELAQEMLDDGYYVRQRYKVSNEEALSKSPMDIARRIFKDKESSSTFEFVYGDEGADIEAFMEHGNVFRNLPHEYESNH